MRRPVQAQDRRSAPRRPHPHERDSQQARLRALARHPPVEPGAVRACQGRHRRPQGRELRFDPPRDLRHRSVRHRDRRSLERESVRDDARVRGCLPAGKNRHDRLRRLDRAQQVRQARGDGRAARRAQTIQACAPQVRDGGRPRARVRHHRVAVQRPRHQQSLPRRDRHAGREVRAPGREVAFELRIDGGAVGEDLHHPARAHALPLRDLGDVPRVRRLGGRTIRCRAEALCIADINRGGTREQSGRQGPDCEGSRSDVRRRCARPGARMQGHDRRLGSEAGALSRARLHLPSSRSRHRDRNPHRESLAHAGAEDFVAALRSMGRRAALESFGKRPRRIPVRGRHLSVQAHRRRPDAHVRGRRCSRAHQPPLPLREPPHAGASFVDRVRFGDAVRPRPRHAPRHLRQDRQLGCVGVLSRRRQEALLGLRPRGSQDLGVDDHQRPRADDSCLFFERGH